MITDKNNLLNELNEVAKPIFDEFLLKIQTELFCEIRVNCVYDSYEDSLRLHELNPLNPVFNFHEFGIALDMNIIKDDRMFYKYDSKEDWESTGVPQLAKQLGIRWGGDFSNYHDPVHFDIANKFGDNIFKVLAKMIVLAKAQFGEDLSNAQLNKTDLKLFK
jgi:hypothetical protein